MKDSIDLYLPGFKESFPDLDPEDLEEQEKRFYQKLFDVIDHEKFMEMACHLVRCDGDETKMLLHVKNVAIEHKLILPESIERKLREWKGKDAFEKIKKAPGSKYGIQLFDQINDHIPISLLGFKKTERNGILEWTRKIGEKEVKIWAKKPGFLPASGDLAKRVFMGTCIFANQRKTHDPGPIEFRELLEMVGKLGCSQPERERIRNYLDSFKSGGMEITKKDSRGRSIYSDYAPFFKRFIWDGGLDYGAKIYPIFNEEIFKLILEENISQYVWINKGRLLDARGLTGRDRLAQDVFKRFLNLPHTNYIMRNWLYDFGQYTDTKILKMPLKEIKRFVNKNFSLALKDGLIKEYKIKRLQKKSKYLNQKIEFKPGTFKAPAKAELSEDQIYEIEELAEWLEGIGQEDYAYSEYNEIKENLTNAAKAGNLDCLREAKERVEDEFDDFYPVDYDCVYENRPMMFWRFYRECVRLKNENYP